MRSPLTPPPEGLSVLTLLPTCAHASAQNPSPLPGRAVRALPVLALHTHPSGIGGHLAGSVLPPSLTKPPCEGGPGQLAAGRPRFNARFGSASLSLHSFSARLCHLLATATAVLLLPLPLLPLPLLPLLLPLPLLTSLSPVFRCDIRAPRRPPRRPRGHHAHLPAHTAVALHDLTEHHPAKPGHTLRHAQTLSTAVEPLRPP